MMLAIAEGHEDVADPDIVAAIRSETTQALKDRDAYRAAKADRAANAATAAKADRADRAANSSNAEAATGAEPGDA
jgi:hypothetical protein